VAALGNEALAGTDEAVLLADATRRVTDTLRVEFSAVLELLPGGARDTSGVPRRHHAALRARRASG